MTQQGQGLRSGPPRFASLSPARANRLLSLFDMYRVIVDASSHRGNVDNGKVSGTLQRLMSVRDDSSGFGINSSRKLAEGEGVCV